MLNDKDYLERSKEYWRCANQFPINKEEVYPEHGKAHNFDGHHNQVCLEMGCGGGSDTLSMLRRGNSVYYVDIVPENVEITRQNVQKAGFAKTPGAFGSVLENSNLIPLKDETMDVVNNHGVLHHIREPEPVLQEFYRILRPGGMLYCMLYTEIMWRHFLPTIKQFVKERNIDYYEAFCLCSDAGGPYARAYTEDEACDLFEENGFEVVNTVNYTQLQHFFRTYWCRK